MQPLALSILAGTGVGFAVKYLLDKRWIFFDGYHGPAREARKIFLYGSFSVAMTLIFWGFEVGFLAVFGTNTAKYTGAVIGLAIGNFLKYLLDRTFTFGRNPAPPRGRCERAGRDRAPRRRDHGADRLGPLSAFRVARFRAVFAQRGGAAAARPRRRHRARQWQILWRRRDRRGEQPFSAAALIASTNFDESDGRLTVEAGVLLSDIIAAFCRAGFSRRLCRERNSSPSAA